MRQYPDIPKLRAETSEAGSTNRSFPAWLRVAIGSAALAAAGVLSTGCGDGKSETQEPVKVASSDAEYDNETKVKEVGHTSEIDASDGGTVKEDAAKDSINPDTAYIETATDAGDSPDAVILDGDGGDSSDAVTLDDGAGDGSDAVPLDAGDGGSPDALPLDAGDSVSDAIDAGDSPPGDVAETTDVIDTAPPALPDTGPMGKCTLSVEKHPASPLGSVSKGKETALAVFRFVKDPIYTVEIHSFSMDLGGKNPLAATNPQDKIDFMECPTIDQCDFAGYVYVHASGIKVFERLAGAFPTSGLWNVFLLDELPVSYIMPAGMVSVDVTVTGTPSSVHTGLGEFTTVSLGNIKYNSGPISCYLPVMVSANLIAVGP